MKIKTSFASLAILASLICPISVNSQEDALQDSCNQYFTTPFIVTGKPFRALLTGDEIAEFRASLFAGTTYRMAVCGGEKKYLIFSVYDSERNLLFTSKDFENAPYWDFKVEGSLDCIVEAKLDTQKSSSGFAMLMTGFKLDVE